MSFSFVSTGSPAAVSAAMDKRTDYESAHSAVAKDAIKKLIEGAPANSIVTVEASGSHHYGNTTHAYGQVDLCFRVRTPEPEPAPAPAVEVE